MSKRMPSILQDEKVCFISGKTDNLHAHHIFFASCRKVSDANGFWVWLSPEWHNMSDKGVHFNRELDLKLKRLCQAKYEESGSRESWLALIGRNYL